MFVRVCQRGVRIAPGAPGVERAGDTEHARHPVGREDQHDQEVEHPAMQEADGDARLEPPMPSTYNLRSIKLYLGETYSHVTSASKYGRFVVCVKGLDPTTIETLQPEATSIGTIDRSS